jgi:hypothetical protein
MRRSRPSSAVDNVCTRPRPVIVPCSLCSRSSRSLVTVGAASCLVEDGYKESATYSHKLQIANILQGRAIENIHLELSDVHETLPLHIHRHLALYRLCSSPTTGSIPVRLCMSSLVLHQRRQYRCLLAYLVYSQPVATRGYQVRKDLSV